MNIEITLREACLEDAGVLAELMTALGYPSAPADMTLRLERILPHPDYKTLVAVATGEVVGAVGMIKNWLWEENGCFVRVQALVVKPGYRQAGIGKLLMEAAQQWADSHEALQISLTSSHRPERAAAHRFYPSLGYELTSSGYKKRLR